MLGCLKCKYENCIFIRWCLTECFFFFQGISLDLSDLPHVDGISVPLDDGYFKNYHYMPNSVNTWDAEYICNYHTLPATVGDQYQLGGYICNYHMQLSYTIYATIEDPYQLGGYVSIICNYHTLPATVSDQYQLSGYICNYQLGGNICNYHQYRLGGYICNYHTTRWVYMQLSYPASYCQGPVSTRWVYMQLSYATISSRWLYMQLSYATISSRWVYMQLWYTASHCRRPVPTRWAYYINNISISTLSMFFTYIYNRCSNGLGYLGEHNSVVAGRTCVKHVYNRGKLQSFKHGVKKDFILIPGNPMSECNTLSVSRLFCNSLDYIWK